MVIHSNSIVAFDKVQYTIKAPSEIPADVKGFIFPFVDELALPDYSTPIAVINKYFKGLLGDTADEAEDAFNRLRSAWAVIAITPWGNELAHMFWCLDVAFTAGALLRVMSTSTDRYTGCLVLGSGYAISFDGQESRVPLPRDTLVTEFGSASPHDAALTFIFSQIYYASDAERLADKELCSSVHDVREKIQERGAKESQREAIVKMSMFLEFGVQNHPLAPTPFNISKVLFAVSDSTLSEREFPLHPSALLESDRVARLWSAFGSTAPSFQVPGGRQMPLDRPFEVPEKGKDKTTRTVNKIGFILKPLKEAIVDLHKVIDDTKSVLNPHGSSIMARSSSGSLIKKAEGAQCELILGALRRAAKVTVAVASGSSSRKRGNAGDDFEERRGGKRPRADDL